MKRLEKLLIANRGEIAVRIQRTAHRLGIDTVAVFSDADAEAPHVRLAGEAVRIGPAPSRESYLRIDALVDAALRTGADAVHPGFGFLSENADFADAVQSAGLLFVGPSSMAIRAMGSKQEAKAHAERAGVPVVPGYRGADQSPETLRREALAVGFPLLLKASAGGGGKGMRIVRQAEELADAIEGAQREALGAFGDATLLVERYVERPRHVEIQILGDEHGNLVHLFERECSIQRRHQKIVEESPSPFLDDELRARMGAAAVAVGRAVQYSSTGTVEFIVAPDRSFYFLEVNTRLQVEHPVTELVVGVDLVEEQLRVARGEPLRHTQESLRQRGHAVEVRLYAEDPERGFLPQSGTLLDLHVPTGEGLRLDAGVESGSVVGIHYDPMLAKLIAHGATREEALDRLCRALRGTRALGLVTNRAYLERVLRHAAFRAGATHTHFVEDHAAELAATPLTTAELESAAIAATVAGIVARRRERAVLPALPVGFTNNRVTREEVVFQVEERRVTLRYRAIGPERYAIEDGDGAEREVLLHGVEGHALHLEERGLRRTFVAVQHGERWYVQGGGVEVCLVEQPRFPERRATVDEGAAVAPMPGKVVKVLVEPGAPVEPGAVLVILEAMKMEHSVRAARAGTVTAVRVAPGEQVEADQVLVAVE